MAGCTGKAVAFYEWPVKLAAKFRYLADHVQSSDRPPTDQAREAHALLKGQLALVQREYSILARDQITSFNGLLRKRGQMPIFVQQP